MALRHQLVFNSCYKLIKGFPLTSIVGDGAGVGKGRTVAGEASVW